MNTPDGTGIRDYIHVSDLADGHIAALNKIKKGLKILNLGTGIGISVLQLIKTFEDINNVKVPYLLVLEEMVTLMFVIQMSHWQNPNELDNIKNNN